MDISTKDIIFHYMATKDPKTQYKTMSRLHRPEVYNFEASQGKQIFEMDEEELAKLLSLYKRRSSTNGLPVSYLTKVAIAGEFKSLFDFYEKNYNDNQDFVNPWRSDKMKRLLKAERSNLDLNKFEKLLQGLQGLSDINLSMYDECIVRLFYDGFHFFNEIVSLKEENIDFNSLTIHLPDRFIKITERTGRLLKFVNSLEYIVLQEKEYPMLSWNNSYFKFIVDDFVAGNFSSFPQNKVSAYISRRIIYDINKKLNIKISSSQLYLLGIYDKIISKFGEDSVRLWLTTDSRENNELNMKIKMFLSDGGYNIERFPILKKKLKGTFL